MAWHLHRSGRFCLVCLAGIDDVIKWWDTSLMAAMFTYWYWFGGGSLLSSVIWSFT